MKIDKAFINLGKLTNLLRDNEQVRSLGLNPVCSAIKHACITAEAFAKTKATKRQFLNAVNIPPNSKIPRQCQPMKPNKKKKEKQFFDTINNRKKG